jgi:hypothetical protein
MTKVENTLNGNGKGNLLDEGLLNSVNVIDSKDVIEVGNRAEEKLNRPYRRPKLFLTGNTKRNRSPLIYLVKSYFEYLPTDEEILNMMLLTGSYKVEDLEQHISDIMSKPLSIPTERNSLTEIVILAEVKAICVKYQNLLGYHMPFRPDINTVGNSLICTGNFNVNKVVNEIAALKRRPKNLQVDYRINPNNFNKSKSMIV